MSAPAPATATAVVADVPTQALTLDIDAIRAQIPALHQQVNGRPLVYLDNGATSLKPQVVIDALLDYYTGCCANVHRGVHSLSQRATTLLEQARVTVQQHIGAPELAECIFVRGVTEGINLIAQTWGARHIGAGDEVLISAMEHHSNIVPWQVLCDRVGATLKVIPFDESGTLDMAAFTALLSPKTKLVSVGHVSNALGTVHPVERIIAAAHAVGAKVLIDGAQAIPHGRVDVSELGCDFYVFSGHKVYAPTGIGVLWGRRELLEAGGHWHGGGDMIRRVTFEETTYAELPGLLEAGTPHIAGIIGLGAALTWFNELGLDAVAAHEQDLLAYGTQLLSEIDGVRMIGTAANKAGVLGFVLDDHIGAHPSDVGMLLDQQGIAVRTGHHCAEPVMDQFGVPGTVRASLAVYNNRADLDALAAGVRKAIGMLS
ncbi:MAG: SufS family cysteine desulfurase [Myxococcales bacterium]|nr:SufS family cysteine desulfurase [Myxococcales bacterium]